jgi:hypothetical protein
MSTTEFATRTRDGRFSPGHSGNPAGRKPGTRNRATILREALREGEGHAGARVVIDKALGGDGTMVRFMLKQLSRLDTGHFVELELPEGALDAETVLKATLRAVVSGEISVEAANGMARFVEAHGRILGKGSTAKSTDADTEAASETVETALGMDEVAAPESALPEAADAAGPHPASPASEPQSLQTAHKPCNSEEPPAEAPVESQRPAAAVTELFPPPGLNRRARRAWLKEQHKLAKRGHEPLRMAS